MSVEQLYVYFKPAADRALAGRQAWLDAAQSLREAMPGLQLQCLTRTDTSAALTWMETYAGLPLVALHAAHAHMAEATVALGATRHVEVFSAAA